MKERKCCITCNKPLIAFQGQFLHPDTPCSGLTDYIDIEATIRDDAMQKKFEDIYGKPDMDDYDRIAMLEQDIAKLESQLGCYNTNIDVLNKKLNHPLIKFFMRFIKI